MCAIITFTFMHSAFIQSDLHCISRYTFTVLLVLAFPGNLTHDLGIASNNALELQDIQYKLA